MDLRFQALSKSYDGQPVLQDVDLDLRDVHALVLIGPSGGGKSTLLRLLGGLERPDRGTIEANGQLLDFADEEALRLHRVRTGFVFQAHNLFPHLDAWKNVALPLEHVHRVPPLDAAEQAIALLRRFGLESHARKRPAELSGGQLQRVAIARALAARPQLLLLDEPTSALDPEMTAEVLDVIAELRAEGRDFVLVTHQMGFARRVADHVAFVGAGSVPAHGTPKAMLDAPESPLVREFLRRVLSY